MAEAEDTLYTLFSRVNRDGTLQKLYHPMVDETRILLHHKNGGSNIVYCENPKVLSILSSVYFCGQNVGTDSPFYDKTPNTFCNTS